MRKAVEILLGTLSTQENVALATAEALEDQSGRSGHGMGRKIGQLQPFLRHSDFDVRAAIARTIGNIGSTNALGVLFSYLTLTPDEELVTPCSFSCWSEEPLYYWIISGINAPRSEESFRILISILESTNLNTHIKAKAMQELAYLDLGEDAHVFPESLLPLVEEFANSAEEEIAESAIYLLGKL